MSYHLHTSAICAAILATDTQGLGRVILLAVTAVSLFLIALSDSNNRKGE